jgi:FkbM family methyltransferase
MRPNPIILDVGANDGEHTKMFMELFPQGQIYSFEPDPRAVERFCAQISGARLFVGAVGATTGLQPFYQSSGTPAPEARRDWDFSGSLRRPKHHLRRYPWCHFDTVIHVPVTTLDTWARAVGVDHIDFLWADVQGAERDLIAGAGEILQRTTYLYTEYSNEELYDGQASLADLEAMLPNFRVLTLYPDDVLFERR